VGDRDDKPGWTEREKLSFSELDRRRRERRDGRDPAPRGEQARQRSEAATRQYLKEIDGLFKGPQAGDAERLAADMRAAHGSGRLAEACRAYRDAVGVPDDPGLLSLFFDAGDPELAVEALGALRRRQEAGGSPLSAGLRTQVRMLSQDADDRVAEAAEELLDAL
jgi:hypothetical protein